MKLSIVGYWGGFPRVGEATSGYLLEHDGFKLLLECGSGVASSVQKITDLGDIDAVLISHYHYDHFCDVGALQYARLIKTQLGQINKILPIYAPKNSMFFDMMTLDNYTKGLMFDETSVLNIGPFEISFMKNIHPEASYSVKIKCGHKIITYSSDTSYFDYLCDFYADSDLLLCECSFYADMDGTAAGHLNSKQAGIIAQKSNVKKLVLTHLPHFGELNELVSQAKEFYGGEVALAKYLMEINI